jgi:pyruvate,orthophosphate dikinase
MGSPLGTWVIALDNGSIPDKGMIGGKAWSIASMSALGLNVPPAFVITTKACAEYLATGHLPQSLPEEIDSGIAWLEERSGRRFGSGPRPLLVSVRSGAAVSMPGMMDTVLNLGITDEIEALLASEWQSPAFARDTHRRYLDLYAKIVLKVTAALDPGQSPSQWRDAIGAAAATSIPVNARDQIRAAIRAVFESWSSPRARRYRKHHGISDEMGTAVTIQSMVFGNLDGQSGTGVLFSRNPLTGEDRPYGEYLPRAQGEEIVSGTHTPLSLDAMRDSAGEAMGELLRAARLLENFHGDAQDIEFTVEGGKLFLLQCRTAKRAPQAAVQIATAMVGEGRIDSDEALKRVSAEQIRQLLRPRLAPGATEHATVIARGEGASPGIGSGVAVANANDADMLAKRGDNVVLARDTTSPNDIHGIIAARATITELGGTTSHAAVVARALGRPCVVGCGIASLSGLSGRRITVDGEKGIVYEGELATVIRREEDDPSLKQLMNWAVKRTSVEVEPSGPPGISIVDMDALADSDAPNAIRDALMRLPKGSCVRGLVFAADDEAVRAAVEAGVAMIVTYPRLPALLVAAQAQMAKTLGEH